MFEQECDKYVASFQYVIKMDKRKNLRKKKTKISIAQNDDDKTPQNLESFRRVGISAKTVYAFKP